MQHGYCWNKCSSDLRSQPDGYESFGAFEETGNQLSGGFNLLPQEFTLPSLQMLYGRFSDVKSTNVISEEDP